MICRRDRGRRESRMKQSMKTDDLAALLAGNTYPGRGIVLGKHRRRQARRSSPISSWAAARTAATASLSGALRTASAPRPLIRAKLADPSLIIYHPVRVSWATRPDRHQRRPDRHHPGLTLDGRSPSTQALRTRTFEPDAPQLHPPHLRPASQPDGSYKLSILKSADGELQPAAAAISTSTAPAWPAWAISSTPIQGDGNPIPSFEGEPERVAIDGRRSDAFAEHAVGQPERGQQGFPLRPLYRPGHGRDQETRHHQQAQRLNYRRGR